jgi:Chain length determinant protein
MAERRKLAEPEIKIWRSPRADEREIDSPNRGRHYEYEYTVELAPYIFALRQRWTTITATAVSAALVTALITGFLLPKWYRATAVIRPIETLAVENRIAGVLGGLGGGFGLGGLANSLGAGGNNDAQEYIAILQGFQFNVDLAQHHHLSPELLKPGLLAFLHPSRIKDPNWAVYRVLEKRFDCDYSIKTGNLTLSFQDHNRIEAENILGYYIDDLRDLFRSREITSASAAVSSLEEEANTTPDSLLRAQLYDLVAKQIERRKMAQVEADFAFRVLDPPAASDKPYRPSVAADSALAALFAALVCSFGIGYSATSGRRNWGGITDSGSQS